MAQFKIKDGSVKRMGENKVSLVVTFKSEDGREVTCPHEVEWTNNIEKTEGELIEAELQKSADLFEASVPVTEDVPELTTGEFLNVD